MSKSPYTSVTETVARILSLLITLLCFSIYILSKDTQMLIRIDWSMLMIHLITFWAAYEVFSFVFFLLLQQFSSTKDYKIEQIQQPTNIKIEDTKPKPTESIEDFDK